MEGHGLSTDQVVGGLIGLGLIAKGFMDRLVKAKEPVTRGCLYGDAAHEELRGVLVNVQTLVRGIKDDVNKIAAIQRRNGK